MPTTSTVVDFGVFCPKNIRLFPNQSVKINFIKLIVFSYELFPHLNIVCVETIQLWSKKLSFYTTSLRYKEQKNTLSFWAKIVNCAHRGTVASNSSTQRKKSLTSDNNRDTLIAL